MTAHSNLTLEQLLDLLPQPLFYANRRQALLSITKARTTWFVEYSFSPAAVSTSAHTLAEAATKMLQWLNNPTNINGFQIHPTDPLNENSSN